MKTAVSIPDEVFKGADRLAKRTRKSRSQLYTDAVSEYLARHSPDAVTEAMDQVLSGIENPLDRFVSSAASRILEQTEW